ncbi:hypothetical protein CIB84_009165 [Bambusicola thoracicus]|uniref:Uncharacterized protein n=1 Tax=Bambusicola thoracicus TaxID=9083 RepID=A0A2P4SSJ5_BAMTH|nr:hypothetical protein CIB84_009165 [Bambusicola thoracicus]
MDLLLRAVQGDLTPDLATARWEVVGTWTCWLQSFLVQFSVLCHSSTQHGFFHWPRKTLVPVSHVASFHWEMPQKTHYKSFNHIQSYSKGKL